MSTFPTALDSFATINANDKENVVSHSGAHNAERAAIAALEAKVGIDSSTVTTTLDHRMHAVETALSSKADLVSGTVPSSQLPSYVDDVLEFANFAAFPGTGETGKIYIADDTNAQYRWSGSAYILLVGGGGGGGSSTLSDLAQIGILSPWI